MESKQLFWLHIKKSAGITTRALLAPYYVEVDRTKKPKNFLQASPEEYNDILNNFRVVLGEYQFRRTLFAKKYLYSDCWEKMYSFAFAREPIDRCLSMFYYLYENDLGTFKNFGRGLLRSFGNRRFMLNTSYAFDVFLDYIEQARASDSNFIPLGLHFTTHTASMWEDITDLDGTILLSSVFRMENLIEGINTAFIECGIPKRIENPPEKLNANTDRRNFSPNREQIRKIRSIYFHDFEIYESAGH